MDGISAAASILAIATAGVKISIKLSAFATQVGTASDRIRSIGNEVSLTSNVLQQLSTLMNKRDGQEHIDIFSEDGLRNTQASADACKRVFQELEDSLRSASKQLRHENSGAAVVGKKVTLTKYEALKWPFLQPNIDGLRTALRDARDTLMLVLQVATLAYSRKLAELNQPPVLSSEEQWELMGAIVAMRHSAPLTKVNHDDERSVQHPGALPELADNGAVADVSQNSANFHKTSTGQTVLPAASYELINFSRNRDSTPVSVRDRAEELERKTTDRRSRNSGSRASMSFVDNENVVEDTGPERMVKPAERRKESVHDRHESTSARSQQTDNVEMAWETIIFVPEVSKADSEPGYNIRWRTAIFKLEEKQFQKKLRALNRWTRKDGLSRYTELTWMEREVIESYIVDKPSPTHWDLGFKKISNPKEFHSRLPWRCVYILTGSQRTDVEVEASTEAASEASPPPPGAFLRAQHRPAQLRAAQPSFDYPPPSPPPPEAFLRAQHPPAQHRPAQPSFDYPPPLLEAPPRAPPPLSEALHDLPEDSEQSPPPLNPESEQIIDELLKKFTTVNIGSTMLNSSGGEYGQASTSGAD